MNEAGYHRCMVRIDMTRRVFVLVCLLVAVVPSRVRARDLTADPSTFSGMLDALVAGDTLHLSSGHYAHFALSGIAGTAEMPIVITGPDDASATIDADDGPCCNTIEIRSGVSYVVLRNLTVDGRNVDGAFGLNASGDDIHHITLEGNVFINHDTGQQNDAISTKTPTSGWVIRGNQILGAGTGMYLGNSDGTDPFVGGLIENNLFYDTIGYNTEIKWQQPHGDVPGAADAPLTTIIRHNVFIKTDRPSPDGDRPNLLVGGFPESGTGSDRYYEIYGNLFVHNPREALFQGSGRVSVHDNVFVDVAGTAIVVQDHDLPLRRAWIYDNTIYAAGTGIHVGGSAAEGTSVVGNVIFAGSPMSGSPDVMADNVVDTVGNAGMYVASPSTTLGEMDFYPLAGALTGSALDLAAFAGDTDYDLDFNCSPKADFTFRGAYAGEGTNPGWQLAMEQKPGGVACSGTTPPPADGGTMSGMDGGGPADGSATPDADTDAGPGGTMDDAGGCGCRIAGHVPAAPPWVLSLLVAVAMFFRAAALRGR